MMKLTLLTILSLHILPINGATIRVSSSCAVDQCASNNQGGGCSSSSTCYLFETSRNTTLCAPLVSCSLFDPCSSTKTCPTNNTVCVLNSCCLVPVCMPVALTSTCSSTASGVGAPGISATPRPPVIGNICPNAVWNEMEEILVLANGSFNYNYWSNVYGFNIDLKNNMILSDYNNRRIIKVPANDTTTYSVIGICNSASDYYSTALAIDSNGSVYSAEYGYVYNPTYGYGGYYRVVMYVEGNGTNGTVIFGEVTCGSNTNQLCWCFDLAVDSQGFVYYSDSNNHRVVRITPFSTTVTVVAGTSGVGGNMNNQLNNPRGIYVDANNTLYVADTNNYRVMMYQSGSSYGTVLFAVAPSHVPYYLAFDNGGNLYVSSNTIVFRWIRSSNTRLPTSIWSNNAIYKIQLDTTGNIYAISNYWYYSGMIAVLKHSLLSNNC